MSPGSYGAAKRFLDRNKRPSWAAPKKIASGAVAGVGAGYAARKFEVFNVHRRYYAPDGVTSVWVDGRKRPSVNVEGNFFTLLHRPGAKVTYYNADGEPRAAREPTAVDMLGEALLASSVGGEDPDPRP